MTTPEPTQTLDVLLACECSLHANQVCDKCQLLRPAVAEAIARARHVGEVAERERCASVCETHVWRRPVEWWLESTKQFVASVAARECAAAIRSLAPAEKEPER